MSMDLDKLALRLHELFVVGGRIHLLQQPNGQYLAIRRRLSVGRIRKMLESQESIGAFQFCCSVTRWVCLDFDLHKDHLPNDGEELDLSHVWNAARRCSRQLREAGLKHLVEFSGNRGFHVWLLLSQKVSRAEAYHLLEGMLTRCGLEGDLGQVVIDRYPKSPNSQSTRGQGVKIPLSKHVKSGGYSYLINDVEKFDLGTAHVAELNDCLIAEQLQILNTNIVCDPDEAFHVLGIDRPEPAQKQLSPGYLRASLSLRGREDLELEEVLASLRRCKCVDGLLKELEDGKNPDEDSRVVLVGLLARLSSETNPSLGLDLLHEFFRSLAGYDHVRTEEKLRNLSGLRPPTCEQLRIRLPQFNCDCDLDSDDPTSPVQYLSELEVEIVETESFKLGLAETHAVRIAQKRYTRENDEVPLHWTVRELENMGDGELRELCAPAGNPLAHKTRYQKFQRIEKDGDTRQLVALSARDKIKTTASTLVLNDLMHQAFSRNSYGYRIAPQFIGGRIFHHWLKQWKDFTSHLGELIYAPEYSDWNLLKVDIKSFYDNIDLDRLRVKLYDGPTPSLRRHYRTLEPNLLDNYRRIADQLLDTCRLISDGGNGVPQGPAFARFLAEVYLMDFDLFVEGHLDVAPDHYARYVDDIFVIVPPNANVAEVEAALLLNLGTLGLNHNPAKHFRGRVSDYRGMFAEYWQDTKYFIDQVSRRYNSAPVGEVRRAAQELCSLVDGGDGAELNREHLSFLYTHLQRDQAVDALRHRIEDYVLGIKEGRGSLFNNFFCHFLTAWREQGHGFNQKLATLDGLRKECFLNMLLADLSESPVEDEAALAQIREVVDGLVDAPGSELEKQLLAALRMHDDRVAGPAVFENIEPAALVVLASQDFRKSIPQDAEGMLRTALLELEFVPFVSGLFDILFNQSRMRPSFLGELLNDFRNKTMEAIGEANEANKPLEFLGPSVGEGAGDLRDRYYQLCCLSSLVAPAPAAPKDVLETIWGNLVTACNAFSSPLSLTSRWVAKLEALPLNDTLVNIVLTQGVRDVVPGQQDKHSVFHEFHQQLALNQMGIAADGVLSEHDNVETDAHKIVREAVRATPARWPLLDWVFNKEPRPDYAPNRNECLANIATNDITVLRSGTDVLVRRRKAHEPSTPFSYLGDNYDIAVDELQNGRFVCETFRMNVSDHTLVEDYFAGSTGLLDFVHAALKLRDSAIKFAEQYRPVGSDHMPNLFATGGSVRKSDSNPGLPQLVLGEKLVVPRGSTFDQRDNNLANFDEALYAKIIGCDCKLLAGNDHIVDMSAEQLDVSLLAAFRNTSDKLDFLADLCEQWDVLPPEKRRDAFEIELCKAVAVRKSIEVTPSQQFAPSEAFFSRYLGLRQEATRQFEYQLLLSPNNTGTLSTIVGVYQKIKGSIAEFCADVDFPETDLGVNALLDADIQRLKEKLSSFAGDGVEPPALGDFSQEEVSIDRDRGGLYLNGKEIQSSDPSEEEMNRCQVFELAFVDRDFQRLDAGRHQTLESAGERVYSMEWQDKLLFVVVPRAVCKAAAVVDVRTKELADVNGEAPEQLRRLACYVNRSAEATEIQGHPKFDDAVLVVLANHPSMEKDDAKQHLQNWLLNMPKATRHLLTTVVAAHEPISAEHEEAFVSTLKGLSQETVVFSLTTSDDLSGWHRLLARRDESLARHLIDRATRVENEIEKAAAAGEYDIALITDVVVSGGQILKGLKKNYLPRTTGSSEAANAHSFPIVDRNSFLESIQKCRRLRIVTARYTENGARRLKGAEGLPGLLGISSEAISIEGKPIELDRCFLKGPGLDSRDQEAFRRRIKDMDFVRSTFKFPSEGFANFYERSISDQDISGRTRIDCTNLVTRRGSTPKWSAMIFRLPLTCGYPSLFEHVGEPHEL